MVDALLVADVGVVTTLVGAKALDAPAASFRFCGEGVQRFLLITDSFSSLELSFSEYRSLTFIVEGSELLHIMAAANAVPPPLVDIDPCPMKSTH